MQITPKTKYLDFEPLEKYLADGEKHRIVEAAAKHYLGEGGFVNLTASQLIKLCGNDISCLDNLPIDVGTVYCVYFFQGMRDFVVEYISALQKLSVKQTPMEQRASNGCVTTSFGEALLVFIRDYFGFSSFAMAEQVTLDEVMLARRDHYNRVTFERNLAQQQIQKQKK